MAMRIANIFRKTLWFQKRGRFDLDSLTDYLQPCREVSQKERYKSGLYYSEKCARHIQYESGLELKFIEDHLENNHAVLFYWEQPIRVPFYRGKIRTTYTPDFGAYLRSGEFVLVEVKSLAEMIDHRVQAKTEGLMEFCSRRGFGLLLTNGMHTPKDLLKGRVNRMLEKEICAALEDGPIRRYEIRDLMNRCEATQSELHRAVIRLDLKFKPFPFKLQRGNQSPIFRAVFFGKKRYDELVSERFLAYFLLK